MTYSPRPHSPRRGRTKETNSTFPAKTRKFAGPVEVWTTFSADTWYKRGRSLVSQISALAAELTAFPSSSNEDFSQELVSLRWQECFHQSKLVQDPTTFRASPDACYNMQTYSSDWTVRSNDYSEDRMHSTSTSFLMAQRWPCSALSVTIALRTWSAYICTWLDTTLFTRNISLSPGTQNRKKKKEKE